MITPLSVGAGTGQKVFTVLFALLLAAVLGGVVTVAGVVLGLFDTVVMSAGDPADPFPDDPAAPPLLIGGFVLVAVLGIVVLFAVMVLSVFRHSASLDGGTLRVRGAFRTRRADLTRARTWIDSAPAPGGDEPVSSRRRVPLLVAQEEGGPRVRVKLHDARGSLLPPHELTALADAIGTGKTADFLRRLADDPAARLL
ncbi:MAG: hypothetical protein HOQ38_12615 [Nonomuraea sp.]|nr:hypothetical protein [Nonomuraea sp.]